MDNKSPDISVFNESGSDIPITEKEIRHITSLVEEHESCRYSFLEIVFVGNEEIVKINRKHLEKDYITDIITFPYESKGVLEGTLFCCAPRIYEQSLEFSQSPGKEFKRVIIHGLLHLCGYGDETDSQKKEMRAREDYYLDLL